MTATGMSRVRSSCLRDARRSSPRMSGRFKSSEETVEPVRRDARTGVRYAKPHTVLRGFINGNSDGTACMVVFDGVGKQIKQDLLQALPVGVHPSGLGRHRVYP